MRSWTTTKSAPSSATCGSAVVEKVPPHPRVPAPPPSAPAVLAFDGGSTKTDVVLVSPLGGVLGRARVGPSNHQLVGLEGTVAALHEALAAVTAAAGLRQA